MGLFGKLTGTQHPDAVVIPLPAGEVRAALLVIKRPDVPYVMRNGTPAERADLVAEWRVLEPAWRTFFSHSRLSRTVKTRMRLDAESHEVRALDEQWEVTWVGVTPRPARSREYSRGRVPTVSRQWEVQRGRRTAVCAGRRCSASTLRRSRPRCRTRSSARGGRGAQWCSSCEPARYLGADAPMGRQVVSVSWPLISTASSSSSSCVRSVRGGRTGPALWPTAVIPAFTMLTA